jgi:uncharacterized protein (TIGR00730 family)
MRELANGFFAMPGGIGTYEELFEVLSLAQLRQHQHPIGLLNVNGFYEPLLAMLRAIAEVGFMPVANLELLCVADEPVALLQKMRTYTVPEFNKWHTP